MRQRATRIRTAVAAAMLAVAAALWAQPASDPRSLRLMGMALEGPVDSLQLRLKAGGFSEWGASDDGEDYYFRGNYYGIRAKLLVSTDPKTRLVASAYVTVGPYRTKEMLERNLQYFQRKLTQEHGTMAQRDGAWVCLADQGSVKLSVADNGNGSHDIRVLYVPMGAFYKDAAGMGLRGTVQEVVTENAVAEEQFMHFAENGQMENPDMTDRQYDEYGYLRRARMTEQEGHTDVEYEYDSQYRLVRRTLTNQTAAVRYVNEYTWSAQGELAAQNQKVFEKDECVIVINMHNNYLTRDEQGNWTSNQLTLSYWEKGTQSQQTTVLQKRTIAYWE